MATLLPALTAVLALVMAVALLDQWRERRQPFQLVWALGMTFFGIASGCEALAAAAGWNEALYRTWYLTGAVLTAGWLGLGTAMLLDRTRFGYAIAVSIFLAGVFTLLTQRRFQYEGAGDTPILYFIGAGLLALAIAVETYFQNERWPSFMAVGIIVASVLALVLTITSPLAEPYKVDPATGQPVADLFPGSPAPADAVPEHHRRLRSRLRRAVLGVRVHAQAARPPVLARSQPEGRPLPVQPVDRARRPAGELHRLAAGGAARPRPRPAPQPRAGDAADRGRRVRRPRPGTRSTGSG